MALLRYRRPGSGSGGGGAIVRQFSKSAGFLAKPIALMCCFAMVAQSTMAQSAATQATAAQNSSQNSVANAPVVAASTSGTIPFDELQHASHNPFDAYRGKIVPPPIMANSARLNSLVRDGKLYLSLRDAIDLALEDNLDMVIARYNLPIAQMDILRTQAGGQTRGVNTGVVSGTPGGAGGSSGSGSGAGGTTGGAGGAGAGASGLVQSTLGTGTAVSNYDPFITATTYVDHTTQQLPNQIVSGIPVLHQNTIVGNFSYAQAFPTGGSIQAVWNNNRQTTNSPNNTFNPQLTSFFEMYAQQNLLAGFGPGPNLRFLHIARANQKISDIAFRAQVIATVTQICDIYWDLVNAYDTEQAGSRSVAFATETLDTSRKKFQLQAIPEMDVLKAEAEVATREQDLTVDRTNLELQELYMKNAITRSLDDPILEEMQVVPTDHIAGNVQPDPRPVQEMIAAALKNRTEMQESALDLQNRELSRKTARNALLPSLSLYGFISGVGYGGVTNPATIGSGQPIPAATGYGNALENALNYTSPDYQVGFQLGIPIRNRIAKADQYRTELEYRQAQVYQEERRKSILIEVRSARYNVEQGASRVQAARKAHDLSAKTLDIMQKEQKLGAGSNQQTLSAEHDLTVAEAALVTAETGYEKARIDLLRATGTVLEEFGITLETSRKGELSGTVTRTANQPVPAGQ
jgi:outer membrane protein TolC